MADDTSEPARRPDGASSAFVLDLLDAVMDALDHADDANVDSATCAVYFLQRLHGRGFEVRAVAD